MKKILMSLIVIAAIAISIAATNSTDHTSAKIKFTTPFLVFINSQPTDNYQVLGEIKFALNCPDDVTDIIGYATKKAKKDFPNCDAVILQDDFRGEEAIKFK